MRYFLRRILPLRQYSFDGRAGKLVAESRLVAELALTDGGFFAGFAFRFGISEISSSRLLQFDRLEQRLEIAFAKSPAALRWMISKNTVGRSSTGFEKICSR